ncbi:MAG: L-rhamnose mutarotase, partial [Bacteroidota bacterium]
MEKTTRYCLACDLKDDPELIEAYKAYHRPEGLWPEIAEGIK